MNKALIVAASLLALLAFVPEPAGAQDATATAPPSPIGPATASDPVDGLRAGEAGNWEGGSGIVDPCLRHRHYIDPWGNHATDVVRVC